MKTDNLIRALAADARPEPAPEHRLAPLLLPAAAASAALLVATLGVRPDLAEALTSFVPAMRHVLSLALFAAALAAVLGLARPEGQARLWPLIAVAAAALGMLGYALATTPAEGLGMALMGKSRNICLFVIPLLSVLPVAALIAALRQGATVRPRLSGFLAGLAGGGLGAAIYALHCDEVSPLFYVTWYGLAVLVVALVSALLGPRLLRW